MNIFDSNLARVYRNIKNERKLSPTILEESVTAFSKGLDNTCVFLSHKSEDKDYVKSIAQYFDSRNVDYYLDIEDKNLQEAHENDDDLLTTLFIEIGIRNCTHILACLSERTFKSWWVPYEIGFSKSENKSIASVFLKSVSDQSIPSYLKIHEIIRKRTELKAYVDRLPKRHSMHNFANLYYSQPSRIFESLNSYLK